MKKHGLHALGILALLALAAAPAQAGGPLFQPLDDEWAADKTLVLDTSFHALVNDPAATLLGVVRADARMVSASAETLDLNLADGVDLHAFRVRSYATASGSLVWSGIVENPGSKGTLRSPETLQFDPINLVILVRNGDKVTGNVHWNGDWFQIRPLKTGGHAIVAMDGSAMPPDHPAAYRNLPTIPMPVSRAAGADKVNTVIRVLVSYTPSVAAASGDINGLIDLAVAESNQGYLNSGVAITMVLASKAQTTYTESGDFNTDLTRYRTPGDGFMDEIHAARDANAADVALVVINNASACGLASSIGSTAATAFASAHWTCITGYYSFAHEIGHLQSARHDPSTDPTNSPFAWGHGFQYTKRPKWRTIMAYDCNGGCPRLNYWSNPNNLYNGQPMGTTNRNNNARVLNDTAATVAAFR